MVNQPAAGRGVEAEVTRLALAVAVTFALGCGSASGQHTSSAARISARLIAPAGGIAAGTPATATVVATRGGRPLRGVTPRVRFAAEGRVAVATGRPSARPGRYALRFRLPAPGIWVYRITIGKTVAGSGHVTARADVRLPGADTFAICDDAGAFWPTETLALDFGSAWIACKQRGVLTRIDPSTGQTLATLTLGGQDLIGVTTGLGSVWALDGGSAELTRIDPNGNTLTARIALGTSKAYNVWTGAGSVWVVDDGRGEVLRIDPATNSVVARIPVGDGAADLVFQGTTAWVMNHRDRRLVQIDARTNSARLVATIPGDAPERMVWAADHLWITGRGTDLMEVDPVTGNVLRTVEIGAGGIDVVAAGNTLWVPARNSEVDARGFPTMAVLQRVDARSGTVTASIASAGPLDVHGLAVDERGVWLADNTHGVLYRVGQ
jgi:DNA-binding beta-propeller fold protein YncE